MCLQKNLIQVLLSPVHPIYSQTSEMPWSVNPGRERNRSDVSRRLSVALAASLACKLVNINLNFSKALDHICIAYFWYHHKAVLFNIKINLPIGVPFLLSPVPHSPWWCLPKLLQILGQFLFLLREGVKTFHPLSFFWDDQFITVCPEESVIMTNLYYNPSLLIISVCTII